MLFRITLYFVVADIAIAIDVMGCKPKVDFLPLAKQLVVGGNEVKGAKRDAAYQATLSEEGHNDQTASWKYLQTECLQLRQDWVVHRFANESCQAVLEIGGYLTPLPKTKYFAEAAMSIALYLNVDPSVQEAGWQLLNYSEVSHATQTYRVDLPITLEEFTAMPSAADVEFDCVVMLGAWHLQLGNGTGSAAAAFKHVAKAAGIVVIESPESVHMEGLTIARPLMRELGFSEEPERLVDCTQDNEAKPLASMTGMLKRHMVAFVQKPGTPQSSAGGPVLLNPRSSTKGPALSMHAHLAAALAVILLACQRRN